jgi:hypothetical protein
VFAGNSKATHAEANRRAASGISGFLCQKPGHPAMAAKAFAAIPNQK